MFFTYIKFLMINLLKFFPSIKTGRSWERWGMDGEMKGGGRDAPSTLWWSSGRGDPSRAPAHRAPGALGLAPRVPCVGHPWLPQAFLSSLTPGPMWLHGHSTQMLICTRPVSPWSPLTPESDAHPRNPLQIPREKRSSSGWMGLGEGSAFLTFAFPSPWGLPWKSCDFSSDLASLQLQGAGRSKGSQFPSLSLSFLICKEGMVFSVVLPSGANCWDQVFQVRGLITTASVYWACSRC